MNMASSKYGGCDNEVRNFKGEETPRRAAWLTQDGTVVNTKQNDTARSVTKIGHTDMYSSIASIAALVRRPRSAKKQTLWAYLIKSVN